MSIPGYSRSQLKNRGGLLLCALLLGAYATLEMMGGSPVYVNYWKQPVFAASVIALAAMLAVGAALPWPSDLRAKKSGHRHVRKEMPTSRIFEKGSPLNDWRKW